MILKPGGHLFFRHSFLTAILVVSALISGCSGRQPVSENSTDQTQPFLSNWEVPALQYTPTSKLISDQGEILFSVVKTQPGDFENQLGAHIFTSTDSTKNGWGYFQGNIYKISQEPCATESPFLSFPVSSSDSALRLAQADNDIIFSHDRRIFRAHIQSNHGKIVKTSTLRSSPLGLFVHPAGILSIERHMKNLILFEPRSLEPLWESENFCCLPLGFTKEFAYGIHEKADVGWFLSEVDLSNGAIKRELQITGPLVSPMVQSGMKLFLLMDDQSGRIGKQTSKLFYEEIDLESWTRKVVDLDASKYGFGHIYSGLEVLVDEENQIVGSALTINGERGRLRLILDENVDEIAFPEKTRNEGYKNLAQIGPNLALSVKNRLHLFDIPSRSYRGSVSFPAIITRVESLLGDLVVQTKSRIHRLRPGVKQSPSVIEKARIGIEPFRFGSPELLQDGNRETAWRFIGTEAHLTVTFDHPVLMPQVTLYPAKAQEKNQGTPSKVETRYFSREMSRNPSISGKTQNLLGEGPYDLTPEFFVAQKVSFYIRCSCEQNVRVCESCALSELEISQTKTRY